MRNGDCAKHFLSLRQRIDVLSANVTIIATQHTQFVVPPNWRKDPSKFSFRMTPASPGNTTNPRIGGEIK
jgi:hypothetical protein